MSPIIQVHELVETMLEAESSSLDEEIHGTILAHAEPWNWEAGRYVQTPCFVSPRSCVQTDPKILLKIKN